MNSESSITDPKKMVARGAAREEGSLLEFEALVVKHMQELRRVAVRLTVSRVEADDLVQEVVLRAWSYRDTYQEGTNLRAWLYGILRNAFLTAHRHRQVEAGWAEKAAQQANARFEQQLCSAPQGETDMAKLSNEVAAAMAELPRDFRDVVRLVDVDELSYQEAASALGCPVGTVMSRLHRGRSVLKRRLRRYRDDIAPPRASRCAGHLGA